jgi:xylulokinase
MSDSKEKYILAIDHGTSGPKTAIVSVYGKVIDWVFKEVPLHLPSFGAAEQDPDDWWNGIIEGAKELIDKGKVKVDDIVGVSNTSQWSGTVAVDKDGNHLMNSVIWMDTRGAPYVEEFHKSILQVDGMSIVKALKWLKLTAGVPLLAGKDPIAHVFYIQNELPDIYEKTAYFLEPQDYINLRLTGEVAASYTSVHMFWATDTRDINNIQYSKKLIKGLKIHESKLPSVLKWSTDILGPIKQEVADILGLNRDTKVVLGAPDVQAAIIGSGAVRDFEPHICIGTSDWCQCHVPYKKTSLKYMMASFPSAIPGKYFIANEQELAGGVLTFLRDNILYHKDELLKEAASPDIYKIFDKIVERTPAGSNNLIFTPWLMGEREPVEDPDIRGGFHNMSLDTTREDLIRAVFEGVAYNVKWLFYSLEEFIRSKFIDKVILKTRPGWKKADILIPEINIIGGGAQSNVWCQIFADVLNRKIKQVKNPIQANARGAAFIASLGLGYIEFEDIPKYTKISNVFTPNPENRQIYDKLFKEFKNIYKVMKKICKRLNK